MRFLFTLSALLLCTTLLAQPVPNAKENVRQAAIQMGDALLAKDYTTFIGTTYPTVIERTEGGIQKLMADIQKQVNSMEQAGNFINAIWPGDPSAMIDTAGEIQCTLPQFMRIKLTNGMLTTQTTLVGISRDKGQTWYFIDAVDQTLASIRQLFPNISSKLVIPPSPEPTFEPFTKPK